jgi:hypothetical protein
MDTIKLSLDENNNKILVYLVSLLPDKYRFQITSDKIDNYRGFYRLFFRLMNEYLSIFKNKEILKKRLSAGFLNFLKVSFQCGYINRQTPVLNCSQILEIIDNNIKGEIQRASDDNDTELRSFFYDYPEHIVDFYKSYLEVYSDLVSKLLDLSLFIDLDYDFIVRLLSYKSISCFELTVETQVEKDIENPYVIVDTQNLDEYINNQSELVFKKFGDNIDQMLDEIIPNTYCASNFYDNSSHVWQSLMIYYIRIVECKNELDWVYF